MHGLVYAHAELDILSLPMPQNKFSHDEVGRYQYATSRKQALEKSKGYPS